MRFIVLFHFLIISIRLVHVFRSNREQEKKITHYADGIEFSSLSRSALLQILKAFEENILIRLPKSQPAVFTADFGHNKVMSQNGNADTQDPGFWTKTSLIQLGYGIWINLSQVTIGLAFGFSAVAVPQLGLTESKINVTISDVSWIASVLTLVSPIGCIFAGYVIDKFGRRTMLTCSQLPMCLGWLYIGYSGSAKDIIIGGYLAYLQRSINQISSIPILLISIGRIITGVGIGMVSSTPRVYMTEISLPNMRGVVGALPNIAMSIGITIQAGLGSIFHWTTLSFICSAYALFLFVFNFGLPETPYFLLQKECTDQAKSSLKKFRSKNHNIEEEMVTLLEYKRNNDLHKVTFKDQILMLFLKSTCKPFWMIIIYFTISQLSGVTVIPMWAVEVIQRSNSSIDAHIGNIILGISRLIGGLITTVLIFKVRRRPMALTSGAGVGVVCVFLGILINNLKPATPLPLMCYVAYILFASLGHYTLAILIMYELFPLQIRGLMGGIAMSCLNFLIFAANKSYPYVRDGIGFANTITVFGICSLTGCIYIYIFMPETKGLTLQETESYYKNKS